MWVRNENVKSQESDKEASKKGTTLSEESFQDNPLSANVVVESGQNCRSKVGNRENRIASKNRIGMHEKHVVAMLEKGSEPRGSSIQHSVPLKHKQLEHVVTSAKGIKMREREFTMQCDRKPSSKKPSIKLSNEEDVPSKKQRENGKVK